MSTLARAVNRRVPAARASHPQESGFMAIDERLVFEEIFRSQTRPGEDR